MARRQSAPVRLEWAGGWAPEAGLAYHGAPQGGVLTIPWLAALENVALTQAGWPKKLGGTSRVNASAVTETAVAQTFEGIFDYWKQGTAGSEAQDRVAVVGTQYMKEDADGTWDQIVASKETGKQPGFTVFKDDCLISTTSTTDVPYVWDQSSGAILGGSPPNFAFSVEHKNRVFAAGVATNMSRLYYCEHLDHEDWTGTGAGSIDVAPDDGDRITGLASHKNGLLIFKGPHQGSIYILRGASPTGDDPFTLEPFVKGVGAINHNAIVRMGSPAAPDDLVWLSHTGVHSLSATAQYGDFRDAYLSAPIQTYYTASLNHAVLSTAWGVNYRRRQCLVWTVAPAGSTAKTVHLVYFYGFTPGRWARWTGYRAANCLAIVEAAGQPRLYAGTTDGFVEQLDATGYALASGAAYTAKLETPWLTAGSLGDVKSIEQAYLALAPKGAYSLTVAVKRDSNAEETDAVSQAGGGGVWGVDTWDNFVWGGNDHTVQPVDLDGTWRQIKLALRQAGADEDMEPTALEWHLRYAGASEESL